ncbi:MAG TPA: hypothetical protein VN673_05395 [Clostridia bacterium]|nr:hypothetical protein [Clostridia bacterium]
MSNKIYKRLRSIIGVRNGEQTHPKTGKSFFCGLGSISGIGFRMGCVPSFRRGMCGLLISTLTQIPLVLLASPGDVMDYDCEIQGELQWTDYSLQGATNMVQREVFTVYIRGEDWLIHSRPSPSEAKDSPWLYSESGIDHTNVYTVSVANTNFDQSRRKEAALARIDKSIASAKTADEAETLRKLRQHVVETLEAAPITPREGPGIAKATGVVQGCSYPDSGFGSHSALIWLAYCSHDHIRSQTRNSLPYVWKQGPDLAKPEDVIQSKTSLSDARPNLPTKVDFYNKGFGFALRGSNAVIEPLLPPFNDGYANAVYEALAWTNVDGFSVPKSFALTVWAPKPDGRVPSDLRMFAQAAGKTTLVRFPCSRTNFVPALPVTTCISDERSGLQYLVQAGQWPMTTNESQLRSYDRAVIGAIRKKEKLRSTIIIAGCVLALMIPLVPILLYGSEWVRGRASS